jgi:hypothetical protein
MVFTRPVSMAAVRARLLVALFVLSLFPSPSAAQQVSASTETNRGPVIPFLEGTDVFWTVRRFDEPAAWFPNRLEADIFPHLVGAQNFTDIIDIDKQQARGLKRLREFAYSISGTPAVRIRMFREVSAPVRTPSYMPRVNVQLLWARNLNQEVAKIGQSRSGGDAANQSLLSLLRSLQKVSLWEAHLIVGHHSNGQDGCITTEQRRVPPDDDCAPAGLVPTSDTVNRKDGSFSTNYVRTGINYSRNWLPPAPAATTPAPATSTVSADVQAVREARLRAEFEYHPRAWVDEQIVDLYGRARFLLGGSYAARGVGFCKKRLEGSAGVVWNPGVVETVPQFSTTLQVSCFPTLNGGWGLFARFYTGQDYYNIGFLDNIARLHVGATFNQNDFFRFRRRVPQSNP